MRSGENSKADELWLGMAHGPDTEDEDTPVYLRLSEPLPTVAELVCSVVGRALGLPVPEPFIVQLPPGVLEGSALHRGGIKMVFASRDLGGEQFALLLRRDSAHAERILRAWSQLVPVATFDEWMANQDRNAGNMIWAAHTLWLIDHAEALGGCARRLYSLAELTEDALTNHLAEMLRREALPKQSADYLDQAAAWIRQPAATLDLGQALACANLALWQTEQEQAELLAFVTHRLTVTHRLLCNRLGHPQLDLQKPSAPPPASAANKL